MADASTYGSNASSVDASDTFSNQFGNPVTGPIRQLAGVAVRRNPWSKGTLSQIPKLPRSSEMLHLRTGKGRSIY